MAGWTIAIENTDGERYCVAKLLTQSNGFSLSAPYHSAREGTLLRFPVSYDLHDVVASSDMDRFTASRRVKLSIHRNFCQFSSIDEEKIRSGIDSDGRPKGLGLVAPDAIAVNTGPMFGLTCWGLDQFRPLGDRKRDVEVFRQSDLYDGPVASIGPTAMERKAAYSLEFFQFSTEIREPIREFEGRRILTKKLPYNETLHTIYFRHDLRVFEHPKVDFFLGLIVSRTSLSLAGESGYTIGSPASWDHSAGTFRCTQAIYPKQPIGSDDDVSLDYESEDP